MILTRRRGEKTSLSRLRITFPRKRGKGQTPVGFADTPFGKGAFFSAPSREAAFFYGFCDYASRRAE